MKHLLASLCCLVLCLSCSLGFAAQQAPAAKPPQQAQQPQVSPEQAFNMVAGEASEKGQPQAMLTLGAFYEQGYGVSRNFIKAFEWYEKAAKAGLAEGMFNLGVCYEVGMGHSGDMAKALQHFEQAAAKGLAQANYKLFTMYGTGHGVAIDESKAFSHLQKAADAKFAPALNEIALVNAQGLLGQPKDTDKAFAIFTEAAESGLPQSMVSLAAFYKDGIGTKADPVTSLRWLLIAQQAGLPQDISPFISEIKKGLKAPQIKEAETKATAWIKAFVEKRQKENAQ